ncbi:MAG: tRNA (N(6)-L-threonylcarbamoyladenosine(37)-C(2))-methylthiotransferase MtaB [Oscillospiraceae bacterium]|nr:tRNA (N(6)-L-threonylcarbamoyladenosine(37)-C(2))-methylthiotransferase MtaB [Oscillospiraceae bacterium]
MKVAFYTLGCKVNQVETQSLMRVFREAGHTVVEGTCDPDACVVNTCTVTAVSDKKSRQLLRKLRREYPDAVIAACGCFPQANPNAAEQLGCCDVIMGTGNRAEVLRLVEETVRDRAPKLQMDDALHRFGFETLPVGLDTGHTRAMLKIEDGCENFCTYCIIPYARGRIRSVKKEIAVAQAKELAAAGYREIVVTGIEISSYGKDLEGETLISLLEALCLAVPEVRIRLGSLEPRTITEEFCKTLGSYDNLCPQFHLSLQSGCDATLKRMNRKYDMERYETSVRLLRDTWENCAVTTDLICGFPGETEEEFAETLSSIERIGFSAMHIFPYSKREGTRAAKMLNQVPKYEKEARTKRAGAAASAARKRYLNSFVGKTVSVLFEEESDGVWQGHNKEYLLVELTHDSDLKNQILDVAIIGVSERETLIGRMV